MTLATQRILIVKTSSLGDIMHGLQVAQTLKENDPGIDISWVVRRRFEALVRASSAVDRTFTFYRSGGISGFIRLCRGLRRERFDRVLDFEGLARSGLIAFCCKSERKIGRSDAREGATLFYKQLVPAPRAPDCRHPVDILLQFCRVFGFETDLKGRVRFALREADRVGGPAANPFRVTLVPAGRSERVEWRGFEGLAECLLERSESTVVRLLYREDLAWADRLKERWGERVQKVGASNLLRMAGCLQESDVMVANDCDALQIGAAVGIGTIGLFGPSDPSLLGPYPRSNPKNRVLQAPDGDLSRLKAEVVLEEIEKRI